MQNVWVGISARWDGMCHVSATTFRAKTFIAYSLPKLFFSSSCGQSVWNCMWVTLGLAIRQKSTWFKWQPSATVSQTHTHLSRSGSCNVILTRINSETNFSTYSSISDKYSEKKIHVFINEKKKVLNRHGVADLRAHDFAHPPVLRHQPRSR
jgi:hypothetical protein